MTCDSKALETMKTFTLALLKCSADSSGPAVLSTMLKFAGTKSP